MSPLCRRGYSSFGLLLGIVMGAVGAMVYCELSSAPDEALIVRIQIYEG
jgi:hypothetical protein